jgi:hypothetical protein
MATTHAAAEAVDREGILVNWRRGEKDRASDDAWNAALRA